MSKSVHYIQLGIHLNKDLKIKSVTIDHNTTDLPTNVDLVKKIAFTLLKSIELNKEDLQLKELLKELQIDTTRREGRLS